MIGVAGVMLRSRGISTGPICYHWSWVPAFAGMGGLCAAATEVGGRADMGVCPYKGAGGHGLRIWGRLLGR